MKTLYISDLDGTLLNPCAELSAYTTGALNAMIAGGLHFSVATARTWASAAVILSGLTLCLPIVLMNGALIYDKSEGRYTQVNAFRPETVAAVIRALRTFAVTGFMYGFNHGELTTYYESLSSKPLRDFVEERKARYHKSFRQTDSFSAVSPARVIYFALLGARERLLPVRDALAPRRDLNLAFYKDNYSPDLWYLELFSDKASKKNAVIHIRNACGYERVVGFGDNLNDLAMFEACDVRVAVENAQPEVKAAADCLCGANGADGVARWLEERGDCEYAG